MFEALFKLFSRKSSAEKPAQCSCGCSAGNGTAEKAASLEKALDEAQGALYMPGDGTGNTAAEFTEYMLERI